MEQQVKEFESLVELLEDKASADRVNCYLELKAREKGVPLHGLFELTPLCNLECKMCYVRLSQEQIGNRELLTVAQWKTLIKQAAENGMLNATLSGGECLAYPGFDEIYQYLQELGIRVNIITNGVLLDEKRIAQFKKYRSAVQVSVYGTSDDAYERVTGKRVFKQVISNLMAAKESGLRIKATITPNRYMGCDDEELIDLLQSIDIPFSVNANLFEARQETGRKLEEYDQSCEDYIRLRRLYMRHMNYVIPENCFDPQSLPPPNGIKCGAGNSGFSIDWQGNMYACSMLPDIAAKPLELGFSTAWMAVHHAASVYPNPIECRGCKYNRICTKCVAVHRNGAPAGHVNKRVCRLAEMITRNPK